MLTGQRYRKAKHMTDAAYYRAQAELSFQIADILSDHLAAEDIRATARKYLHRAEELEQAERALK